MKQIFKILCIVFAISSCSSIKKYTSIEESTHDGLRHESLYRYSSKRLLSATNSPLSLCHNGDFSKAQSIHLKELDTRKESSSYWNELGTCYYLQNQDTQARFYYQLALGLAKNNTQKALTMNNLGLILLRHNKFNEAKEHFDQSAQLYPQSLTPKYNLSHLYINFGHYEKAENILKIMYNTNKQDVDFIYQLGHIQLMQYRLKEASFYFKQIPKEYLTRQDIANDLAMLHIQNGDYDKAKKILDNSDKNGPKSFVNTYVELDKAIKNKLK